MTWVQLQYDHFEVLVIDNNTTEAATWQPVADYVATLPDRKSVV